MRVLQIRRLNLRLVVAILPVMLVHFIAAGCRMLLLKHRPFRLSVTLAPRIATSLQSYSTTGIIFGPLFSCGAAHNALDFLAVSFASSHAKPVAIHKT